MKSPVQIARTIVERLTGFSINRSPLPHGTKLFSDLAAVREWEPPSVVFDVGAHQGYQIRRFVDEYPQAVVHAFEPASANREMLAQTFAADARVRIHGVALGREIGESVLHLTDNSTTHSLVHAEHARGGEVVTVTTLDAFCEREGVRRINYCKIDTEGADLDVLVGATRMLDAHSIDFVQVETSVRHDTSYFASFWDIDAFLNEKRYEVFGFYEQQPCWTGRSSLLFFNAVYIRSSLVDSRPVFAE